MKPIERKGVQTEGVQLKAGVKSISKKRHGFHGFHRFCWFDGWQGRRLFM